MIDNNAFVRSELDYRTNRIRTGMTGRRRSRVRAPFVRRPAETSDQAR